MRVGRQEGEHHTNLVSKKLAVPRADGVNLDARPEVQFKGEARECIIGIWRDHFLLRVIWEVTYRRWP